MDLRLYMLLAIVGTFPLLGYAVSQPKKKEETVVMSGSGDGVDSVAQPTQLAGQGSDDEDDIYLEGSGGDKGPAPSVLSSVREEEEEIGSGGGDILVMAVRPDPPIKGKCEDLYCWCVFVNGTEVPGSRVYAAKAKGCPMVTLPSRSQTTTAEPAPPTRARETPAPDVIEVVTEEEPDFVVIDSDEETTTIKKVSTVGVARSTTVEEKQPVFNNKPTVAPPLKDDDKQKTEEDTNRLADNKMFFSAVKSEEISAGYLAHPGILAAIIGGGIVGLLCAILLVMFIVYRMRKKDEGSYPLNDSKPLKDYAYSKAPSREFYA